MPVLKAESEELMSLYRRNANEYDRISNALRFPEFSTTCSDELTSLLRCHDAARLVLSVARIENFGDANTIYLERQAVSKLLAADGLTLKRGKRTKAGMFELVRKITPVLLYFGLHVASSEKSHLVVGLRLISEDIGLPGDPRDELRRWISIEKNTRQRNLSSMYGALLKGLRGSSIRNTDRNTD